MSTYEGHFWNGLSFIGLSMFWTKITWHDHFRSQIAGGPPFQSRFTSEQPWARRFLIRSIINIMIIILVILLVLLLGLNQNRVIALRSAQNSMVIFFFGLTGVVDLMRYYEIFHLEGFDSVAWALAFTMEAFTFGTYMYDMPPAEVQAHSFLLYAIAATIACLYLEIQDCYGSMAAMARSFFTLLQGTWLIQIRCMFNPPFRWWLPWSPKDSPQMMLAACAFCWHCAADIILISLVGALVYRKMRRQGALNEL